MSFRLADSGCAGARGGFTSGVFAKKSNGGIAVTLVVAVLLWGANNAGTKFLVRDWPLVFLGATRLFAAGLLLLAILRWTNWLGPLTPLPRTTARRLWLHGGLCLAVYIVLFNFALKLTSASHVALYLGASPIWALLWEERPAPTWHSGRRYGAALLAMSGVVVLSWPSLKIGGWLGEMVCLTASVLWTAYSRQCRAFGGTLSGAEVARTRCGGRGRC